MADEDPSVEELAAEQRRRERAERASAEQALTADDAEAHARRADKAAYLRSQLRKRADADEGEGEGEG